MKPYLTIILMAASASLASAVPFQFDTGVSYVRIAGAHYETNPDPTIINEVKHRWAPYVGIRSNFSEMISLRVAYQYISNLETNAVYSVPPGPGDVKPAVVTPARYRDDIHVVSVGPQFRFHPTPALSAIVSVEANWVNSRGSVRYWESTPISRNESKITAGGSVSLNYELNPHFSLETGYRVVNASPSWSRTLHMFSAGIAVKF